MWPMATFGSWICSDLMHHLPLLSPGLQESKIKKGFQSGFRFSARSPLSPPKKVPALGIITAKGAGNGRMRMPGKPPNGVSELSHGGSAWAFLFPWGEFS